MFRGRTPYFHRDAPFLRWSHKPWLPHARDQLLRRSACGSDFDTTGGMKGTSVQHAGDTNSTHDGLGGGRCKQVGKRRQPMNSSASRTRPWRKSSRQLSSHIQSCAFKWSKHPQPRDVAGRLLNQSLTNARGDDLLHVRAFPSVQVFVVDIAIHWREAASEPRR